MNTSHRSWTAALLTLAVGLMLLSVPAGAQAQDWEYGQQKFQEAAGGVGVGAGMSFVGAGMIAVGVWGVSGAGQRGGGARAGFYPVLGIGVAVTGWIAPLVIQISGWHARSGVRLMGGRMPVVWGVFSALFAGMPGANYGFALANFGASHRLYLNLLESNAMYGEGADFDEDPEPLDDEEGAWDIRAPIRLELQPVVSPQFTGMAVSLHW